MSLKDICHLKGATDKKLLINFSEKTLKIDSFPTTDVDGTCGYDSIDNPVSTRLSIVAFCCW